MSGSRTWISLGLVALLLAIFGAYYWVHKPISPAQALGLLGTGANLGIAALLAALGGGLGRRLLAGLPGEASLAPGERVLLEAALGWGLLALAILGLGLMRALWIWLLWPLAILLLFLLRRPVLGWAMDLARAGRTWSGAGPLSTLAVLYVILVAGLGLLRALAPPLMWDALVYHLTLPKLYVQTHGVYLPLADFSLFSGMPQLAEMLYTAAAALRVDPGAGSIAAQTLGWAFGLILIVGLAGASERLGLPGPVAAAVLLSSFSVALSLAWAYGDLLLMLMALAMLLALREWRRQEAAIWLAAAGVFAGLAFGGKYTGLVVGLGGLGVIAQTVLACPVAQPEAGRERTVHLARVVALFLAPAALAAAPWLLKNWLTTGNPIYPLVFPSADMDAARLWFYNRPDQAEHNPLWAAAIFLRAALLGVQGGNDYDVTLGPLLVFLPLALLAGWRRLPATLRGQLVPPIVMTLVAYAAWVGLTFITSLAQQARLFFALLPILALLGAAGLDAARRLDTPSLRGSRVVGAAVAIALVLAALESALYFVNQSPLAYLAGAQSATDYQAQRLGWYPYALGRVNALPPGSRVEFLWEARSLGCAAQVRCIPDVIIDRWWHLRRTAGTAAAIAAGWRAEGVTHVLIYETGQAFARREDDGAFEIGDWAELDRLRALLQPVDTIGGAYTLYALP